MSVVAYLGLGSNIGDRIHHLTQAIVCLQNHSHIIVRRYSAIYETAPIGYVEQDMFYNLVCEIETTMDASELLQIILDIEQQLHRVRTVRWGPRTIDIDLLLYHDKVINQSNLVVPHPHMTERAFVIVPLAELIPEQCLPGESQTIRQMQTVLISEQQISKLDVNIRILVDRNT